MVLYSAEGLEKLGVTEEQMETKIADEMSLSNEVATNSMVNLQFNLVHVAKVWKNLFWYSNAQEGPHRPVSPTTNKFWSAWILDPPGTVRMSTSVQPT